MTEAFNQKLPLITTFLLLGIMSQSNLDLALPSIGFVCAVGYAIDFIYTYFANNHKKIS